MNATLEDKLAEALARIIVYDPPVGNTRAEKAWIALVDHRARHRPQRTDRLIDEAIDILNKRRNW